MILIIVSWIQKRLTAQHTCKTLITDKSYIIWLSKVFIGLNKYRKVFNEITRQGILISHVFWMFNTNASKTVLIGYKIYLNDW